MKKHFNIFTGPVNPIAIKLDKLKREKNHFIIVQIINKVGILLILFFSFVLLYKVSSTFRQIIVEVDSKELFTFYLSIFFFFVGIVTFTVTNIINSIVDYSIQIEGLKEELKERLIERENYKKIKPIEGLVKDLKYNINIKGINDNKFEQSLKNIVSFIKETILPKVVDKQGNYNITEEMNIFLYVIFKKELNGNNSENIINKIASTETILPLLYYVSNALKELNDINIGLVDITPEEFEKFMISLKKILEKRYKQIEKEKKNQPNRNINKKPNMQIKKSDIENKSKRLLDNTDLDDNSNFY